jgi:hypothetical protein
MNSAIAHKRLLGARIILFSSVGAVLLATASLAANVDYEGEPLGAVPPNTQLAFPGPIYVQALADSEIEDGESCAPNCPDNGTNYQLSHGEGFAGALLITGDADSDACTPNCNLIDLYEIDVAEPSTGTGPISLIFYGSSSVTGESYEFSFLSDGIVDGVGGQTDFETVVLPDTYRDLDSVLIISATPYLGVAIDNIIVDLDSDLDLDGILDSNDNCSLAANPAQDDTDGDDCGNICDADYDQSGTVGFPDFGFFRQCFGTNNVLCQHVEPIHSGRASGFGDFGYFTSAFGTVPGPSGATTGTTACP